MRFINRVVLFLSSSVLLAACVKEIDTGVRTYDCFYATVEEDDDATRAHFEQSAVKWDSNDEIGIFSDKQTSPLPFTRNSSGSFVNSSGISGSTFYAFYPSTGSRMSNDSYLVTFSIPAPAFNQNSIKTPMVATGSGNSLSFKQSCGVLHFYIKGSGSYDKISLKSNNGTYIAGTGQVDLSASYPVLSLISDISTEIVGSVPSGLNWQNGVDVYFVLPPLPLNKGFTLTLENTGTNTKLSKSTDKSVTITRQKMTRYTVDLDELAMSESGKPYVDLGLSVMWATYNLGATKPEEYGGYFAWGEIAPKNEYSWETYKWCNGTSTSMNKYNTDSAYGNNPDNVSVLSLADDAAHANWGGNWRMPTDSEWTELGNNCTWTWTNNYNGTGVTGRIVTSNKAGYTDNSIFLPALGRRYNSLLDEKGSWGYYWSSSLYSSFPHSAWYINFDSSGVYRGTNYRYYGYAVRPVLKKNISVTGVSLNTNQVTMSMGSAYTLTATVQPENASNKKVTWKSSDTNIAKVDDNGKITPVSIGNVTITVTTEDGKKTASCSVTVKMKVPAQINMGLSVKWADCNLGAVNEEDYGFYYAWGETAPKSSYSWSTYIWCGGSDTSLKKYNTKSGNGTVDNKTMLEAADDAATVNLGTGWRMPTKAEIEELINQCTWTWTTVNGVKGYKVTRKNSSTYIFLPAAGSYSGSNSTGKTNYSYYWSSTLNTNAPEGAYSLDSDSDGKQTTYFNRYRGLPVRAVHQ